MEIEIFDSSVLKPGRIYRPAVHVSKAGLFAFNPQAVEQLNLAAGNTISFVRDKTNPRDWYILRDPNGLTLREKKNGQLMLNAKIVRDLIFESVGVKPKNGSMKFLVAKEPVQHKDKMLYAILTTKPL